MDRTCETINGDSKHIKVLFSHRHLIIHDKPRDQCTLPSSWQLTQDDVKNLQGSRRSSACLAAMYCSIRRRPSDRTWSPPWKSYHAYIIVVINSQKCQHSNISLGIENHADEKGQARLYQNNIFVKKGDMKLLRGK
jgi:hypothetical protein